MEIYVVRPGDTLYSVALSFGVSMARLQEDNQLPNPARLVVGQTLVIQYPKTVHTVRPGESLSSIAAAYGATVRQLLRNNPGLGGLPDLVPGQNLVIDFQQKREGALAVSGYAYPEIEEELLRSTLPYLTQIAPFTYGITAQGDLVPLRDEEILEAALAMGVLPLLHLSTLTEEGVFSNETAHAVLTDQQAQDRLVGQLMDTIARKGYRGLDIDFEFVYASDAPAYAAFVARMRALLFPLGLPVIVALAPKTSADQRGDLYEGHNYALLSQAADFVLLMTYEWGYTYGPPMAVAPLPNVRRVVEYALTEMPAGQIYLGIPNYGYDWTLPYRQGSRAQSISNQYAVELAARYGAAIRFDERAQSPWFRYVDESGREHEVWFEDARSIRAKLALTQEYGLYGVGYWNLMRPFPQNWRVLNSLYQILD